jgi:catechol 2,3-dioxygenase-like lactoylglutathione lyase family enzyme
MPAPLVDHIGILVPDLDAAIARWSAATGYTFSPVGRYRTAGYSDESDTTPHAHDARFVLSRETGPAIELLEVTGSGTHGPHRTGIHHLALRVDDAEAQVSRLAGHGIAVDAWSREPDGRMHICFSDRAALDGIALEFISNFPGPIVTDDGSPAWRDPATGRASLWGPQP